MIIVNFSHPLNAPQLAEAEKLAQEPVERVVELRTQFADSEPFAQQVQHLLAGCDVSPREWQTRTVLVVLPSHNVIAATLLAELDGRTGYLPSVLRLRPTADTALARFEVQEIVPLQQIRDRARTRR